MSTLHYLTVQDFLWMSFELTEEIQPFNFAKLEEAVNTQYSYGSSNDLAKQAARLLKEFRRMKPFAKGNEAMAFLGTAAFLELNGYDINLEGPGALTWVRRVWDLPEAGAEEIKSRMKETHAHHHGVDTTKDIMIGLFARYEDTLKSLLAEEPAKALA